MLRTQSLATAPAVVALTWGALVGSPAQTWIWLGAFVWDFVFTYATSRGGGGWHLYAPAHWAERYGLIVILALGESIVAIGVGVAEEAIDGAIVLGTVLAVTLSILLWRAYFASPLRGRRTRPRTAPGCRASGVRARRLHVPALLPSSRA